MTELNASDVLLTEKNERVIWDDLEIGFQSLNNVVHGWML